MCFSTETSSQGQTKEVNAINAPKATAKDAETWPTALNVIPKSASVPITWALRDSLLRCFRTGKHEEDGTERKEKTWSGESSLLDRRT